MSARTAPPPASRDPVVWCWACTLAFLALLLHRLAIPSKPYFDEIHYLPAARGLLTLDRPINREHPMFAKEAMALALALLGDRPFAWRIGSALAGTLALLAAMRAVWWGSLSRSATVFAGVLLASNFILFVSARIAMLDPYMLALTMTGLWLFARALRCPTHARSDLALCGVAFGLAIASKWSAAPVAMVPGLLFALVRLAALRQRPFAIFANRTAPPVAGIALPEAVLWLGVVPLLVYFATFLPALFYRHDPLAASDLLAFQAKMGALQESVIKPHPYQSRWWQWLLNLRPIWYLYEQVDSAQRGILLLGNPWTMLAGLPALLLCLWWGWHERCWAMLGAAGLFAVSLGPWLFVPKPIQFYYHYLLPATFLSIGLGLVLARFWGRGHRAVATILAAPAAVLFVWFYPILSAAELQGSNAFLTYTWLTQWR